MEYVILKYKAMLYELSTNEQSHSSSRYLLKPWSEGVQGLLNAPIHLCIGKIVDQRVEDLRSIFFSGPLSYPYDIKLNEFYKCKNSSYTFSYTAHSSNVVFSFPFINNNHLLLILEKKDFTLYSELFWQEFCKETMRFFQRIIFIQERIEDERRYKELYRVTEKFHSSMDDQLVLMELMNTLKRVYHRFDYTLLLTNQYENIDGLPVTYFDFDSANLAVMEAFTGGVSTFEKIPGEVTLFYAPLRGKQGVYGVLQVETPFHSPYLDTEIEFIRLLADTAGSALENAKLYKQSKKLISDLQLINETSHHLNRSLRLTDTLTFLGKQITKHFHSTSYGFVLLHHGEFHVDGSEPFMNEDVSRYLEHIMKKMKQFPDSIFMVDVEAKLDWTEAPYKSVMAVPMMQSGEMMGVCIVLHKEAYAYTFEMFKFLQSIIDHSTLAIHNSILRDELERLVSTDYLTQLYNRSYLDKMMGASLERDECGSFILIDIDDFKLVNDTHGHQVGDEVIVQVGSIMQKILGLQEFGARWGGEELAIYLPNWKLEKAVLLANELSTRVRKEIQPSITISCGVAYWDKPKEQVKNVFHRADTALYFAKENGKNQVVSQTEF
ncbi:diguanylate cyclase domain-containing protein [Mangrovibacillus cuniculi]|uniref:Diguanylate cyclase n=1 Tax=Mangrovibacillus cuniculi TaxID=2593652 RepID=A0A7S8CC25_9BACI|nr:diguanylate cyclase [Mangrovibacillus cuniculi]QPC47245.1 diguanylate cyclase [Mangrovibacillus cuniculi]